MKDFGIIVTCCFKDYNFAKACCASIRHFLGKVPVCLIIDGSFSTSSLEETYDVSIINHQNVSLDVLRQKSFGWGLTKMIAFWESPWKNFLYLDADTIPWGNVLKFADFKNFDLVIDEPYSNYSNEAISRFFFDIDAVKRYFPHFRWWIHPYFITGVFFGKRGVFSLDEYVDLLDFNIRYPGIFKYGEQGILNFMLFRAVEEGRIRVKSKDMQVLVRRHPKEELNQRFPFEGEEPANSKDQEAAIIHWAGMKPYVIHSEAYVKPMQFFRQKFLTDTSGFSGFRSEVSMVIEDFYRYRPKAKYLKKLFFYAIKQSRNYVSANAIQDS